MYWIFFTAISKDNTAQKKQVVIVWVIWVKRVLISNVLREVKCFVLSITSGL